MKKSILFKGSRLPLHIQFSIPVYLLLFARYMARIKTLSNMAIEQDQPQSAFPQELPPRPSQDNRSWKNRNCPNMRTCWHFSLRSYDPRNTPNKRTLFRKISMILILALRTALSVLSLISAIRAMNIAKIVIYAILSVLGFWFVAWCLAEIGEATGERQVLGRMIVSRLLCISD